MPKTFTVEVGGRILTFETGKMAAQASGAVFATYGDTGVLVTAVGSERLREGIDFLPLTVDYMEMSYAAGRIPGRSESRPRSPRGRHRPPAGPAPGCAGARRAPRPADAGR